MGSEVFSSADATKDWFFKKIETKLLFRDQNFFSRRSKYELHHSKVQ